MHELNNQHKKLILKNLNQAHFKNSSGKLWKPVFTGVPELKKRVTILLKQRLTRTCMSFRISLLSRLCMGYSN